MPFLPLNCSTKASLLRRPLLFPGSPAPSHSRGDPLEVGSAAAIAAMEVAEALAANMKKEKNIT
jgi:hypothetical protein